MLSYQHGYHAGCFADVVKHLTLTRIIDYMTIKEKPLFYLETHSGRGIYDLSDTQANKTAEYRQGISLLWEQRNQAPAVFKRYIDAVKQVNDPERLRYYPGSPWYATAMLREQDRLICCELHPTEFRYLEQLPLHHNRLFFNNEDGTDNLISRLPPPERRGLIFIDPSYEIKNEYKQIPNILKSAYNRFASGTYCLWYPLLDQHQNEQLLRGLGNINAEKTLRLEFYLTARAKSGMSGCGLWIINPPYTLAEDMKIGLKYLSSLFNPGISSWLIE